MRIRSRVIAAGVALGLLVGSYLPGLAQSGPCPIVADPVVAGVLGGPVQTAASPSVAPGLDSCDFIDSSGTDYAVTRELGAFQPGEPTGAAILVIKYVGPLADQTQTVLTGLNQPGSSLSLPGYQLASVDGLGDSAVFIKAQSDSGALDDSLLIQRGADVFALGAPDAPDTPTKLNSLAQAILTAQ